MDVEEGIVGVADLGVAESAQTELHHRPVVQDLGGGVGVGNGILEREVAFNFYPNCEGRYESVGKNITQRVNDSQMASQSREEPSRRSKLQDTNTHHWNRENERGHDFEM